MQIAKRVYSLAQDQNDSALMMGAYRALAGTLYYLGNFESARQYAMRAVQIWRSGGVQSHPLKTSTRPPSIVCATRHYASGNSERSPLAKATIAEAISVAKELNDMHTLASALYSAAYSRLL